MPCPSLLFLWESKLCWQVVWSYMRSCCNNFLTTFIYYLKWQRLERYMLILSYRPCLASIVYTKSRNKLSSNKQCTHRLRNISSMDSPPKDNSCGFQLVSCKCLLLLDTTLMYLYVYVFASSYLTSQILAPLNLCFFSLMWHYICQGSWEVIAYWLIFVPIWTNVWRLKLLLEKMTRL